LIRIISWNCRSGSVITRLSELAEYEPDIVFLQECGPVDALATCDVVGSRTINGRKGIALLAPAARRRAVAPVVLNGCGRASIAAEFVEPVPFSLIGIWAQGPAYVEDVLMTLRAHAHLLRAGRAVVIGDFNSGSRLGRRASLSTHHRRVLDMCTDLGLASAYHAFHGVEAGGETHATYFHQFARSKPWHIDLCFVPRAWTPRLLNVAVLDGRKWARRSDHRPLVVDLETP
jgi:exodeoxyribonuclease-3